MASGFTIILLIIHLQRFDYYCEVHTTGSSIEQPVYCTSIYMHIKVAKYEPFVQYTIIYVIQSQKVFLDKITNDDTCILTSSVSPSLPIFNV